MKVTAHHRVAAAPGGSRVTLSIEYAGPMGWFVAWLTRGLNERYLKIEAEGLKRRSESRHPPAARQGDAGA